MRVTVTIFLLVLLTVTQTPMGQLLKLPVLVEHFNKHMKQDGVSLLEFFNGHYSSEHHDDDDQQEDEKLPFKTVVLQNMGYAIVPTIIETNFFFNFDIPTKVMLNDVYTPQQHLCSIFHPPRGSA